MNNVAANPLMITTGKMLVNGFQHCWRVLGQDRARNPKFPVTASRQMPEKAEEAGKSKSSHPLTLSRMQSRETEQHQQPSHRVNHMRRDQPRLAGNNRHGGLTTGM